VTSQSTGCEANGVAASAGPYSAAFFSSLHAGSEAAARRIVPLLFSRFPFASVVDVGCGGGEWLKAARECSRNPMRLCGIDGFGAVNDSQPEGGIEFVKMDLEERLKLAGRFDLCLCLEVAEHLSAGRAESFVEDLTALSEVVVFSGAIPMQGGYGHIHEQWAEYWALLFAAEGFAPYGRMREEIWMERTIPWWYRQNLIVYVKRERWSSIFPTERPDDARGLTRVHPECFLWHAPGSDAVKEQALKAFHELQSAGGRR
jgi:SAM-dependent methyltransferase